MAKRVTEAEKEFVRKHYKALGAAAVAAKLGRTKASIHHIADRLDMPTKRRLDDWTEREDAIIRSRYPIMGSVEVAAILGRSPIGVGHRAVRLGIKSDGNQPKRSGAKVGQRNLANGCRWIGTWKRAVKDRDDFTCRMCGLREPLIVSAHHVVPIHKGGDRFDLANGITLCPNCHALEHAAKGRDYSAMRVDHATYEMIRDLLQDGKSIDEVASVTNRNHKTIEKIRARR